MDKEQSILTLRVKNRFGVLTKITALFGRRGCNIDYLTAEPAGESGCSDIAIRINGQTEKVRQIFNQMHKLEDVAEVSLRAEPLEEAAP